MICEVCAGQKISTRRTDQLARPISPADTPDRSCALPVLSSHVSPVAYLEAVGLHFALTPTTSYEHSKTGFLHTEPAPVVIPITSTH